MISGKVALGALSFEFGRSEKEAEKLATEAGRLAARCAELAEKERELVERLARIRLPDLSDESVAGAIKQLRDRMRDITEKGDAYRREVGERLAALPATLAASAERLARAVEGERVAAEALETARQAAETSLSEDADHMARVIHHRRLMERRSVLGSRRARLLSTATVERTRYDRDRAFSYLRERAWGEPEYRGGPVARRLDGWLARRIGYPALIRNYRILLTGPHAIEAERRRLTAEAEALEGAIDARQETAEESSGLRAALEVERKAQAVLVEARAAHEEMVARRDALAAERRALDADLGAPHEQAVRLHREFLERLGAAHLLELAEETPDPRDDALVAEVEAVRSDRATAEAELKEVTDRLERAGRRSVDLGEVARKAAARFNSRRSRFSEELNLERLVKSILDGDATSADALRSLSDAHVPEPIVRPSLHDQLEGWFAELSSVFDPELEAVSVRVEEESDAEGRQVTVYDANGRIVHRRITTRRVESS